MKKSFPFLLLALVLILSTASFSGCGKSKTSSESGGSAGTSSAEAEPDVTFKDLQGKNVALSSFKGKVVLLNFWATWCEPCRVEIPWMIEFQQKYSSKGFTMLGVAMDDDGAKVVSPFVTKPQFSVGGHDVAMDYPIVLGTDDIASKLGGLIGLPTSVMISRDGKIVKRYIGLADHEALDKEIQSLL